MSFQLDIYKGWDEARLKVRCLELVRTVGRYEMIIGAIVKCGKESLSKDDQAVVARICSQWADED